MRTKVRVCWIRRLQGWEKWTVTAVILLLLASHPVVAQTAAPKVEANTAEQLTALRGENARLTARVDSLTQSLRDHRSTENFIGSALEQQTTFYGVTVTIILAVFGLLTWNGIRFQIKQSEKNWRAAVNEQARHLEETVRGLEDTRRAARRAAGNAYMALGEHDRLNPGSKLATWLLASANFYAADTENGSRTNGIAAKCLVSAREALEEIEALLPDDKAQEIGDSRALVQEALNLFKAQTERPEVLEAWASIRGELKKVGFTAPEEGA